MFELIGFWFGVSVITIILLAPAIVEDLKSRADTSE